jgi:hypothetical protein
VEYTVEPGVVVVTVTVGVTVLRRLSTFQAPSMHQSHMVTGKGSTMAVMVTVVQLVVAVTVEAGTWIYWLQNGIASAMYLWSTSALRTLSRLHVFRSPRRGVDKAGAAASKRVKKVEKSIFDTRNCDQLGSKLRQRTP